MPKWYSGNKFCAECYCQIQSEVFKVFRRWNLAFVYRLDRDRENELFVYAYCNRCLPHAVALVVFLPSWFVSHFVPRYWGTLLYRHYVTTRVVTDVSSGHASIASYIIVPLWECGPLTYYGDPWPTLNCVVNSAECVIFFLCSHKARNPLHHGI
jgi:hypothetical protein